MNNYLVNVAYRDNGAGSVKWITLNHIEAFFKVGKHTWTRTAQGSIGKVIAVMRGDESVKDFHTTKLNRYKSEINIQGVTIRRALDAWGITTHKRTYKGVILQVGMIVGLGNKVKVSRTQTSHYGLYCRTGFVYPLARRHVTTAIHREYMNAYLLNRKQNGVMDGKHWLIDTPMVEMLEPSEMVCNT